MNKNLLRAFVKESLMFEVRLSKSGSYLRSIIEEIDGIEQRYIFEEASLERIRSFVDQGCSGSFPSVQVKDTSTGQVIDVNPTDEDNLIRKYHFLYVRWNRDAFGVGNSLKQENYYCRLGINLFLSLNRSGITKVSFFDNDAEEQALYDKFIRNYGDQGLGLDPFIKEDAKEAEIEYIEFVRRLLVRMSLLTKNMLKNSVGAEGSMEDFDIKYNEIDKSRIKRELEDYDLEFASNRVIRMGNRRYVIVKTKNYGNVGFYNREGTGTGNNLFQGNRLKWLPFGGFQVRKDKVADRRKSGYTAVSYDTGGVMKLPHNHPESDGTGKYLKLYGEFFYIALKLTNGGADSLTEIHINDIYPRFYGKTRKELKNLAGNNPFDFNLSPDIDGLYGGAAMNNGLFKKGALKTNWLKSNRALIGSKEWGKYIGHNIKTFKNAIKNV